MVSFLKPGFFFEFFFEAALPPPNTKKYDILLIRICFRQVVVSPPQGDDLRLPPCPGPEMAIVFPPFPFLEEVTLASLKVGAVVL